MTRKPLKLRDVDPFLHMLVAVTITVLRDHRDRLEPVTA